MITRYDLKARGFILAAALLAGLGFVTHATAQVEASYLIDLNSKTATELESLGGVFTRPNAINDAGQVVGYSQSQGVRHAFITGPDGEGMRGLGTLGDDDYSIANGINNAGQVVGYSVTAAGEYHAFITGPDGVGMRDLGTLGGDYSVANGINNAGQAVGYNRTSTGYRHAFITGPDGVGMTDLGTLGGDNSSASGINNTGQVVGYSGTSIGERHAFITGPDGMGMRDIGTLENQSLGFSTASAINDAGQVVGWAAFGRSIQDHAFITGPDGVGMTDIGTLGGHSSRAYGINDAGQVVGRSNPSDDAAHAPHATHAFITGPDGMGMTDLNALVDLPNGFYFNSAYGINNAGQVIATAIPEPETYLLMLVGLGLIGFMARRKKTV